MRSKASPFQQFRAKAAMALKGVSLPKASFPFRERTFTLSKKGGAVFFKCTSPKKLCKRRKKGSKRKTSPRR